MPILSVHVLGEGERVPMLHDELGLPLFYPTLFATSQLRNDGAAVNTIRNKLADLIVLMRWERQHARDLIEEFRCVRSQPRYRLGNETTRRRDERRPGPRRR